MLPGTSSYLGRQQSWGTAMELVIAIAQLVLLLGFIAFYRRRGRRWPAAIFMGLLATIIWVIIASIAWLGISNI